MKKILLFSLMAVLYGCSGPGGSSEINLIPGPQGDPRAKGDSGSTGLAGATGSQGLAGTNGHSLVSQFASISAGIVCANGGSSLDIYMDIDDDLLVSAPDSYLGSMVACNGANGLNGTNGLDGTTGATGSTGTNGTNGTDGSIGATGSQGLIGATGPQGVPGPQGV